MEEVPNTSGAERVEDEWRRARAQERVLLGGGSVVTSVEAAAGAAYEGWRGARRDADRR